MKVDKETIRKIAHLARLEFENKAEDAILQDFNKILDWMDKLNQVKTDHVEPLIHMSSEVNVLREDVVENSLKHEEALSVAPKKGLRLFQSSKILRIRS
jgi:aspartyl-tRNA(Asn)/glutamyl-tRNA(Gln) amidotransferase subunit C